MQSHEKSKLSICHVCSYPKASMKHYCGYEVCDSTVCMLRKAAKLGSLTSFANSEGKQNLSFGRHLA